MHPCMRRRQASHLVPAFHILDSRAGNSLRLTFLLLLLLLFCSSYPVYDFRFFRTTSQQTYLR